MVSKGFFRRVSSNFLCEFSYLEKTSSRNKEVSNLFESLFMRAPWGVAIVGVPSGKVIYANEALLALMDCQKDDVLGHNPPNFFANPSRRFEMEEELLRTGEVSATDIEGYDFKSRKIKLDIVMKKIEHEGSLYILSLFKRSPAEATKDELKDHLVNSVLDHIPASVFVKDLEGNYLFVNKACAEISKKTKEQMLGTNFKDLITKDLAKHVTEIEAQVIEKNEPLQYEATFQFDGKPRDYVLLKFPLRSEAGLPIAVGAVVTDITKEKKAESELADWRNRLELAIKATADGIWDWNLVTNEVFFSTRWKEMLGYRDSELESTAQIAESLLHPNDRKLVYDCLKNHLEHNNPFNVEMRMKKKDGGYLWILNRGQVIRDALGRPVRMTGSHTDITAQKRVEEELLIARGDAIAALRLKTEFLATISHEIRTPLNAIIGLTELLSEDVFKPEQKRRIELVQASTRTLLSLVNDTLDLSKIEAGKLSIQSVNFSLKEIVDAEIDSARVISKKKKLKLDFEWDSKIPSNLIGDPERFMQVCSNLIANAIKFTEKGSIKISFNCLFKKDDQVKIRVEVRDTGVGIPDFVKPYLFQPFVQGHSGAARKFGGTGLGLSICNKILQLMGGRIGYESEEGNGALFWFEVDFGTSNMPLIKTPVIREDKKMSTGFRLLLVEDNVTNQILLRGQLREFGAKIDVASNGEEGLRFLKENTYDLVLMDGQMPVLDGLSAARQWRQYESQHKATAVPIIAFTANAAQSDRELCLEAGMDDVLTKPVAKKELLSMITKWLPQKKKTQKPRSQKVKFKEKLLASFRKSSSKYLKSIHTSIREQDKDQICFNVHALKSSVGALEIHTAFNKCNDLESNIGTLSFQQIKFSVGEIEEIIKDFLSKQKSNVSVKSAA